MKKSHKAVITLSLALTLVLGSAITASAVPYYNLDTGKIYNAESLKPGNADREELKGLDQDKVGVAISGKAYSYKNLVAKLVNVFQDGGIEEVQNFFTNPENLDEFEVEVPGESEELEVIEISAIDKTVTLDVTVLEPAEGAKAKVVIFKLDDKGEKAATAFETVTAAEIKENVVTVDLSAKTVGDADYAFVVTVGENEAEVTETLEFKAVESAVKLVNDANTQIKLLAALENPLFEGVAVEANSVKYQAIIDAPNFDTVAEVIAAVKEINAFDGVLEELNEAAGNQLAVNNILKANFEDVNSDNIIEYITGIYTDATVDGTVNVSTTKAIQDVIYLVNAEEAVKVAETKQAAMTLKADNVTQAEIDEVQTLHDAAFALVDALIPANPTEKGKLTTVKTAIGTAEAALKAMNIEIGKAEDAMADYVTAGGDVKLAVYTDVVAELAKDTKVKADITSKTGALVLATKDITAVDDAEATQAAHLAAGGEEADVEYVAVQALLDTPTNTADLIAATEALEAATKKLVVYADVMAATTKTEMRALLFDLDALFLELSSAVKTDFAEYVLVNLAEEDPAPANFTALNTLVFTTYKGVYDGLIDDVNTATAVSIAEVITALEAISEDYADLGLEAQADAADAVIQNMPAAPGYTTIAEILTVAGL